MVVVRFGGSLRSRWGPKCERSEFGVPAWDENAETRGLKKHPFRSIQIPYLGSAEGLIASRRTSCGRCLLRGRDDTGG
jgi:hypothetical protein